MMYSPPRVVQITFGDGVGSIGMCICRGCRPQWRSTIYRKFLRQQARARKARRGWR